MKRNRVGIYLRVSTDEQAQVVEGSLDSQSHRLRAFVDIKNLQEPEWGEIIDCYVDDGISAKNTKRPAFQKMMSDIRKERINLILVTDLSRLSRNIMDFCQLLEELRLNDSKFLSLKEQFDTSTPAGEMMVFNMINLAQFERKQTSERVSQNFHSRALRGLRNGGPAILGYSNHPKNSSTYLVADEEAAQVREIFRIYMEEGSLARTVSALDRLGIRPKMQPKRKYRLTNSGHWSVQTLLLLLRNHAYIGMREVNKKNKGKSKDTFKSWERYSLVRAVWPAIVDEPLFNRVQKSLEYNRDQERGRLFGTKSRNYYLSRLIKCGYCGRYFGGASAHGRTRVHRYYKHPHRSYQERECPVRHIKADLIEDLFSKRLPSLLRASGFFCDIGGSIESNGDRRGRELRLNRVRVVKDLADISAQIDDVINLRNRMEKDSAVRIIEEKLLQLQAQKGQHQAYMDRIDCDIDAVPVSRLSTEDELLEQFFRGWKKASMPQRRRFLLLFIRGMVWKNDVLTIVANRKSSPDPLDGSVSPNHSRQ